MSNLTKARTPFASLADRYSALINSLDLLAAEAIVAHGEIKQRVPETSTSSGLQDISRLLDESVFQLRLWASELTHRSFSSMSEKFAVRDLDTHSVLSILETATMPVMDGLRRIFDKLEADALTLSQILKSTSQVKQDHWYNQVNSVRGAMLSSLHMV